MHNALSRILLLLAPIALSAAPVFYQTTYTFDLTAINRPVTNLVAMEVPESLSPVFAQRFGYNGPGTDVAAGGSVTSLAMPFLNDTGTPWTTSVLMGIVQDLPNDPEGQKHIVLFIDPATEALTTGVPWSAFFPEVLEEDLIAALELGTSGGLGWGNDFATLAPGLSDVAAFLNSLRAPGGLLGPGGEYTSPYFALPAPGAPASNFVAVAFSDGQTIGTGSVIQTQLGDTDVPEPATLIPAAAAFAGLFWKRLLARRAR
ncbi:MAG: hypothetical protein JST93_26545 [Acidobacteria bacterium]|nr:hypothetical protein [Acidobacteriota bacterium]